MLTAQPVSSFDDTPTYVCNAMAIDYTKRIAFMCPIDNASMVKTDIRMDSSIQTATEIRERHIAPISKSAHNRWKFMIVRSIESHVPMPRHATRWYVSTNQVLAEVVLQSHQIVSLSRVGKTVQNPKLAEYLK